MAFKALLVICVSALFVQSALSQICGASLGLPFGFSGYNGLAAPSLAGGYGAGYCNGGVASTGGGLPVTSVSPISPTGISVISENTYEGALSAGGNLPFLSTVALDGVLPTTGVGAISYGCGNSAVGIAAEEGSIATGIVGPSSYPIGPAAGIAGISGYGPAGFVYGLSSGNGYKSAGLGYSAGIGYGAAGIGSNGLGCGCGGLA